MTYRDKRKLTLKRRWPSRRTYSGLAQSKNMHKMILVFLICNSFTSLFAHQQKEVYGPDNRLDLYQMMPNKFREWASATAALVIWDHLAIYQDQAYLQSSNLQTSMKVCADEKFVDQPSAATCSGFLVAPDLIVTAGHCLNPVEKSCGRRAWIFDFALLSPKETGRRIPLKNIYFCQEILLRIKDQGPPWNDLALIRLNRKVEDRLPLPVRHQGIIPDDADLVMIGNPSGLPTKVAASGKVMDNTNNIFFKASLDAFGRNSGSAVIDVNTGLVEGLLVRGSKDYQVDPKMNCLRPYFCQEGECQGAEVTRISNFFKEQSNR